MGRSEIEAVSGIFGAMSVACWVVVFSPQIFQNFRRKNADGLSLHFILIWLVGDIFNIIGSILQGVMTSMIVLAVYYTVADLVLLCQMFFYRGFTFRDIPASPSKSTDDHDGLSSLPSSMEMVAESDSRRSVSVYSEQQPTDSARPERLDEPGHASNPAPPKPTLASRAKSVFFNTFIILAVGTAGFLGWFIKEKIAGDGGNEDDLGGDDLEFDITGQVFGYLCAATYIASRIPQLLLNWRRKTTEGLSMLFFAFAFLGNTTYIISILAYDPKCDNNVCRSGESSDMYKKYFLINLSWLGGSLINLTQDCGIFTQYFLYRKNISDSKA